MHLAIPTHFSIFWVVCHLSRTFFPKEFEQEPQNRLSPSPHRQTIPSLTSDPWPTIPILAGYKLVVPEPYACSISICVHCLSVAHAFAMTWKLVCAFCCSFLISCGLNGFLSLCSLWLASFLGWALLDCGLFSFRRLASTFAMPFCYSCSGIVWSVLVGLLLGLQYAFLLLNFSGPILSLD